MKSSKFILFSIGSFLYGIIEILWRGYTHWSMLLAGGVCFVFFGEIAKKFKRASIFFKALIGSAFITLIEFVFGLIFNIILKKGIWDYSGVAFNFCGQICLLYSFFWFLLSLLAIPLAQFFNNRLQK